jgi:RNA polymerase sigma factor (TIGR02999 family)
MVVGASHEPPGMIGETFTPGTRTESQGLGFPRNEKPFSRMSETIHIDNVAQFMGDLRAMAQGLLRCEENAHSVRPTGLVLSALRRNKGKTQEWGEVCWKNRQYFFGAMHKAMRRALCDYARKRRAQKRPPLDFARPEDLNLHDLTGTLENRPDQIEALDEALAWLEKQDPELAEIVQYRYFSGCTVEQTARLLESSERTIKRRWTQAKLLLHDRILCALNETKR